MCRLLRRLVIKLVLVYRATRTNTPAAGLASRRRSLRSDSSVMRQDIWVGCYIRDYISSLPFWCLTALCFSTFLLLLDVAASRFCTDCLFSARVSLEGTDT